MNSKYIYIWRCIIHISIFEDVNGKWLEDYFGENIHTWRWRIVGVAIIASSTINLHFYL